MDLFSIGLGVAAVLYGLITFFMRIKYPAKFAKLEAMKKFWGERKGLLLHTVSYSVLPILIGVMFIYKGFLGQSAF
jgi:hypothetical protein